MRRTRAQMRERDMILPEAPAGIDDDSGESYVRTEEAT
jgi:hypothetical protein